MSHKTPGHGGSFGSSNDPMDRRMAQEHVRKNKTISVQPLWILWVEGHKFVE